MKVREPERYDPNSYYWRLRGIDFSGRHEFVESHLNTRCAGCFMRRAHPIHDTYRPRMK